MVVEMICRIAADGVYKDPISEYIRAHFCLLHADPILGHIDILGVWRENGCTGSIELEIYAVEYADIAKSPYAAVKVCEVITNNCISLGTAHREKMIAIQREMAVADASYRIVAKSSV